MLYDHKRWDKPRVDPTSRKSLIAWLEAQPADEPYIHTFGDECLLGQWLQFVDPKSEWMRWAGPYVYTVNGSRQNFSHLQGIAHGTGPASWTFGKALERARAQL